MTESLLLFELFYDRVDIFESLLQLLLILDGPKYDLVVIITGELKQVMVDFEELRRLFSAEDGKLGPLTELFDLMLDVIVVCPNYGARAHLPEAFFCVVREPSHVLRHDVSINGADLGENFHVGHMRVGIRHLLDLLMELLVLDAELPSLIIESGVLLVKRSIHDGELFSNVGVDGHALLLRFVALFDGVLNFRLDAFHFIFHQFLEPDKLGRLSFDFVQLHQKRVFCAHHHVLTNADALVRIAVHLVDYCFHLDKIRALLLNLAIHSFAVLIGSFNPIFECELIALQLIEPVFEIQIMLLFLEAHIVLQFIQHRGHTIVSHLVGVLLADHRA